jgi:hypothetical protein
MFKPCSIYICGEDEFMLIAQFSQVAISLQKKTVFVDKVKIEVTMPGMNFKHHKPIDEHIGISIAFTNKTQSL